jgi:hypothetical protein
MAYVGLASPYTDSGGYAPSRLNDRSANDRAKDAQKYLQVLAEVRLPWEWQIDNLIMYVNHGRRSVQDKDLWPGQPTGMEIYDDSAMLACSKLVDGMVGYLYPRNQQWFVLELPGKLNFPRTSRMRAWNGKRVDSYPEVQKWLQDSQDVMESSFNRSNFYDVVTEFIRDDASCGTAHFLIEEDIANARTICTVPHFRECYIAENRFGQVDTNYRVCKWTLRQFVDKFGIEAMKKADVNFEKDYESNMHSEREVLHAVYPRKDYNPGRIDAKGKRWESIWVYRQGGKVLNASGVVDGADKTTMLSEGGYDSMPIMTTRWRKNSDETYGRSPAHDAWVAIATANQMGRTNLITAQKAAEPPMAAYEDQRGKIMRGPNGLTFIPTNRGSIRDIMPQPLTTGVQNLPFNIDYQGRIESIINEHFHADIFTMLSQIGQEKGMGRPVTEQIFEMQGEKAAVLGTRIGNLQTEFSDPAIARFFDIEARAGRIPEPPQILLESEHEGVKIQYLGMLAQAQKRLSKVRAIQSGMGLLQMIAQFDPLAPHYVDTVEIVKEAWTSTGAPASCLLDIKTITKIRQMAQEQQEKQQQIENAPKIAKAAALAGKAAEPDSPLKTLMGGGKEPGE